jgi:outer membrane protein, multidrug efflux system
MRVVWLLLAGTYAASSNEPIDRSARVAVPSTFQEVSPSAGTTSAQVTIEEWWTVLQDPVLDSLVRRSASSNHDVRIAASRIAEARAAGGIARSALLPEIGQNTSVNRIRGGFSQGVVRAGDGTASGQSSFVSPFETTIVQGGLEARWEIDLFGGLRKKLTAAKADVLAAEEIRRDVLLVVTTEVARHYIEFRGVRLQLAIAERNRDVQRDMLDLTRVRAKAGLATELDVERQAAQLSVTEAAIPTLQVAASRSLYRLSVLTGDNPASLRESLERSQQLPPAPIEVPAGLPSDLLKRRPDIRRAQAEIAAALNRAGAARTDLFPKFVFTGFSGRQATSVSGLTLGAGNFFGFGPGIQFPLFTGGRIRSNIEVQEARLQQALRVYEQEVLAAIEETETALAAYRGDLDRRASLAAAVSASQRATGLARELYLAGLGDFLSVLEAQRSLFAAEDELQKCETGVRTSLIALFKALGGGIQ